MSITIKTIQITPIHLEANDIVGDYTGRQYKIISKGIHTTTLEEVVGTEKVIVPKGEVMFCDGQN